jgi:hypothetical protein
MKWNNKTVSIGVPKLVDVKSCTSAELTALKRKSDNQIYLTIRRRIAEEAARASPFGGIVNVGASAGQRAKRLHSAISSITIRSIRRLSRITRKKMLQAIIRRLLKP